MLKRVVSKFMNKPHITLESYSQCGEDLIVNFILRVLRIETPTYLDLGANDPFEINNTAFFYKRNFRGVCVEPDPDLFKKLSKARPKDKCLNIGVGLEGETEATFYLMSSSTLNTFSKEEAERYASHGTHSIKKTIPVKLKSVNQIISENFAKFPTVVSLDIEGLDYQILKTFDFSRFRPEIFCIETLTYTEDKTERKIQEIIELMISQGYMIFADTYINTIFVDRKKWLERQ